MDIEIIKLLTQYGGGGGGGAANCSGGAGASGAVYITYTLPATSNFLLFFN